ncbi:hypothetical protein Tco_0004502 [Tanacetum coccineum]
MNVEATDASSQPQLEQMDEGFTATVYPNVQENLKLIADEPVILEEPTSSTGTLSSLQHLAKDFSHSLSATTNHRNLNCNNNNDNNNASSTTSTSTRLYKLENQDIPNQVRKAVDEIVTDAVDWAMQAPLREPFRDLPEADMK